MAFTINVRGRRYSYRDVAQMRDAVCRLDAQAQNRPLTEDERDIWNSLNSMIEEQEARGRRVAHLERAAENPAAHEDGARFHDGARGRTPRSSDPRQHARDVGLRAIERMSHLSSEAGDRLTSIVERDHTGQDGAYLAAVGDPAYLEGFMLRMIRPESAPYEMTDEQHAAMRAALWAESQRALSVGSGVLPVPASIDPTINLTSDGALNPIRELASVTSISSSEWHGVTSAGMTVSFDAELAVVSDDTPALQKPVIVPQKAQGWCEYSIEAGQDWASLASELTRLFADSRDNLEAEKFITGAGSGSNEPEGLVAGLAGTSFVTGAGSGAFAVGDLYSVQNALPPRFSPRARWLTNLPVANATWQFVAAGDTTEARIWNDQRTLLLGKPWTEVSTMPGVATGNKVAVYGDIQAAFKIVDRAGMAIEPVPLVMDPATGRPQGKRGIYIWWRVGSAVLVDNAVRALNIR